MTEQTEAAEVARVVFDAFYGDFAHWGDRSTTALRMAHDRAEHVAAELAAHTAAAEARGAGRVLALLARVLDERRIRHDHAYPMEVGPHHCGGCDLETALAAARAAAMTISSEKSSSLATRVPQDESQHTGGGS